MPVYFFNVRHGDRLGVDTAGVELPDLEAVRARATELAREIMSDVVLTGEIALDRCVEVTDRTGALVLALPFADVVEVKPPRRAKAQQQVRGRRPPRTAARRPKDRRPPAR